MKANRQKLVHPEVKPVGRPTLYTVDLAEEICDQIADGHSLRQICDQPGYPDRRTVLRWLGNNPDFVARANAAWQLQAEAMADEMITIIEQMEQGELEPQAARVIVDILKWRAAKLAPKKYGESMQLRHAGAVGVGVAPLEMDAAHAARVARAILEGMREAE